MASITWGRDLAEIYDATCSTQSLDPMLGRLVELARDGEGS